jgi:PTS system galactitol-specific IIA component
MTHYIDEELVFLNAEMDNQEQALKTLSDELVKKDYVTDEFYTQVVSREKKFPTGMTANGIGIALPHTDDKFVKTSKVAFMRLNKPVKFQGMEAKDQVVDVQLVFMIALTEPAEKLAVLQLLMDLFSKQAVAEQLVNAKTASEVVEILNKHGLR